MVTYTPPHEPLFTTEGLARLRALRDDLQALEAVGSTNSILNVPLLHSPDLTLDTVDSEIKTLDEHDVAPATGRQALLDNPMYPPNLLISEDGKTTAIQVNLPTPPDRYFDLLNQRNELREKVNRGGEASEAERTQLEQTSDEFIRYTEQLGEERDATINQVRAILEQYRDHASIHLGGACP